MKMDEEKKTTQQIWRARNREKILAQKKKWYADNKEKIAEQNKIRRDNNREYIIAQEKEWRDNNKEKLKAQKKKWRDNNADQITIRDRNWQRDHKDRTSIHGKKWRQNNPDKRAHYSSKRRAIKIQATPKWAEMDLIQRLYKESRRLNEMWGTMFQVDHIYPLNGKTVCGLHCHANLQLLDKSLNISKSNTQVLDE